MSMEPAYRIYGKPRLKKRVLIAGWAEDAAHLGMRTLEYIMQETGSNEFGEINPEDFFTMAGVNVEDDVAIFPQSKFYMSGDGKLVIFKSSMPRGDWYRFLNTVLDVAQKHCGVKEIYTVGAMLSSAAHTMRPTVYISFTPQCFCATSSTVFRNLYQSPRGILLLKITSLPSPLI